MLKKDQRYDAQRGGGNSAENFNCFFSQFPLSQKVETTNKRGFNLASKLNSLMIFKGQSGGFKSEIIRYSEILIFQKKNGSSGCSLMISIF